MLYEVITKKRARPDLRDSPGKTEGPAEAHGDQEPFREGTVRLPALRLESRGKAVRAERGAL